MDCTEARERLSDYQDGGPDSASAGSVGAHLRECAGCAETARSLAAVREGLRRLPPVAAPPELMERVREAVAREGGASAPVPPGTEVPAGARSLLSRLRIPLEAAAAVLLVASIWWYQKGPPTESVSGSPQAPAGAAAPAPKADPGPFPRLPEKAAISPSRESKPAGQPSQAPPAPAAPAGAAAGKADFASLPAGTPEPKPRDYSPAELPAAPAVRASSESPRVLAATPARPPGPLPYGREVVLDVTPEARESAGERIAAAARRLGGGVERVERDTPGGYVAAVRVLLPEPAAPVFLSELDRIGKVPPEGKPADSEAPAGPARGTVAYTVRIRVR